MGGRGAKSKVTRKQKRINGRMKGGWPKKTFWSKKSSRFKDTGGYLEEIKRGWKKGSSMADRT